MFLLFLEMTATNTTIVIDEDSKLDDDVNFDLIE